MKKKNTHKRWIVGMVIGLTAVGCPHFCSGEGYAKAAAHPDYASMYPGLFVLHGPTNQRKVALTFDDGPDQSITPQILSILKKEHVRATFFLVGVHVREYPWVVRRIVADGHAIGNHTWDHPLLPKLSLTRVQNEVARTDRALYDLLGYHPALFRPPYGSVTGPVIETMAHMGYHIVDWNVDSMDWRGLSRVEIENNVLPNVHQGSIVLQHSGGAPQRLRGTVEALPDIIHSLHNKGYEFVTVPEMLHCPPYLS